MVQSLVCMRYWYYALHALFLVLAVLVGCLVVWHRHSQTQQTSSGAVRKLDFVLAHSTDTSPDGLVKGANKTLSTSPHNTMQPLRMGDPTEAMPTIVIPTLVPVRTIDNHVLWKLVNRWRASEGMAPYTFDEQLCFFAEKRLKRVQRHFTHDGFATIITDVPTYHDYAENLAQGWTREEDILDAWLSSARHERNLRWPYTHACIVTDGDNVVHIFANKEDVSGI